MRFCCPRLTFVFSPLCILGALFVLRMGQQAAIGRYTLSCWFLPRFASAPADVLAARPDRADGRVVLQVSIILFALQRAAVLLPTSTVELRATLSAAGAGTGSAGTRARPVVRPWQILDGSLHRLVLSRVTSRSTRSRRDGRTLVSRL